MHMLYEILFAFDISFLKCMRHLTIAEVNLSEYLNHNGKYKINRWAYFELRSIWCSMMYNYLPIRKSTTLKINLIDLMTINSNGTE